MRGFDMSRPWRKWLLGILLAVLGGTLLAGGCANGGEYIEYQLDHTYSVDDQQFIRTMGHLLGPPLVAGNDVDVLVNGDEIFPAMLEAIRGAENNINFETYVYWEGDIGMEFAEAFAARQREGVPVQVIIDWFGMGNIEAEILKTMKDAGVSIEIFNPMAWYNMDKANNRTHRKLLIVDGKIAFTGGVGIAEEWTGDAQDKDHWRDNHYRVEGPVVAHMQRAFMDHWLQVQSRVLHGGDYFPQLKDEGDAHAQMFISSNKAGSESVRLMYLLSIAAASQSIRIATPYFVPDPLVMQMLEDARERGVDVEIIVPGHLIDMEIVRQASRNDWDRLLEAGVKIYEYQPTMYHTKMMIVDEIWTSVGSTNFDNRSFRLNDEANLNVYDVEFAKRQAEVFEADKAESNLVTFEDWKDRPLREKIAEQFANLFGSQL